MNGIFIFRFVIAAVSILLFSHLAACDHIFTVAPANIEETSQELKDAVQDLSPLEIKQFLENLVQTESENSELLNVLSIPLQISQASTKNFINALQTVVLNSDDIDLIQLYHRAVRNYNSLAKEKANPVTTYYKHYRAPDFYIPDIQLTFDVKDEYVHVVSSLSIVRNRKGASLILDGRDHQVQKVLINGELIPRSQYKVTKHELILLNTPDDEQFLLEIHSLIDPFHNTTLEGMYLCNNWLTTQCESEGARRIFFTLDRPDVLSRITTTIIADKSQYPYRLSNGNLLEEANLEDGRTSITWQDPFPKPSYLFACVLGNFSMLKDNFTTRSGLEVELQVYVEQGKENRAFYSLYALKKAMEFDELFFDREYDLSCLKMVGIPDFNSGAMENKGLMIFNDTRLLVDSQSGTDSAFRSVAHVVSHEYFHNWSGNRVTVRNWFEIALKEAFTDWRAIRFGEWLFGEEFIRPKDVCALREYQFPEEYSENAHPIMVESYVDAHAIYDGTTYVKGREVFRAFEKFVDSLVPGGFREALNIYFSKNDGKAVTFRELLSAADEVLARAGMDSKQFERWFHQQGTPQIHVEMIFDEDKGSAEFIVSQSCPNPKTGALQQPFVIPFSIELVGNEGIISQKIDRILYEETTRFSFAVEEKPTPIFMHSYSAPVILHYDYTMQDLARIMKFTDDAFSRWEASQNYAFLAIKTMLNNETQNKPSNFKDFFAVYLQGLQDPGLSPLAKVQLLQIPSVRALSQELDNYDFVKLAHYQKLFKKQLSIHCKPLLQKIYNDLNGKQDYAPTSEQMQVRELRNACLCLLASSEDRNYQNILFEQYKSADNFNDMMVAFSGSLGHKNPHREFVRQDYYDKWKNDKAVFNYWLSAQASLSKCTVENLIELESVEGYDSRNPNHIRSVCRVFCMNLGCYHDAEGKGYRYMVDKILEVGKFNPMLAHNYLADEAFQDFENLPEHQRALMAREIERLQDSDAPAQTRDLVSRMLKRYKESQATSRLSAANALALGGD